MNKKPQFSDLHCHPGELIYHKLRGNMKQSEFTSDLKNNPTRIDVIRESCPKLIKGKMAGPYLQSDFFKSSLSKSALLFVALYPLEMGFATGKFRGGRFISTLLSNIPFLNSIMFTLNIKKLNVGRKKYLYIRSGHYDYYDELQTVSKFYGNWDDEIFEDETFVDGCTKGRTQGKYKIIRKSKDVSAIENPAEISTIGVVFTIEGMHSFGTGHIKQSRHKDVDHETLIKRIIDWKKGDLPIFFITFSHHFNNTLCGHAHSFPKVVGNLILAQEENLAAGFTQNGLDTVHLLLNLGKYSIGGYGRRILIDIKHMSPLGRKEYYLIVKAHNIANPKDQIPIVASHMGYTGRQSLDDIIYLNTDDQPDAKLTRKAEKDKSSEQGFEIRGMTYFYNPWGINLSGEDVREIVRSRGLIGISMDERILAAKRTRKWFARKRWSIERKRTLFSGIILNNILGIFDAIYGSNSDLSAEEKSFAPNCLCLGSDFDGYINPLDAYAAVSMYDQLRNDLVKEIAQYNIDHPESLFREILAATTDEKEVIEWVDKFIFRNAFDFLSDHWPTIEQTAPPVT